MTVALAAEYSTEYYCRLAKGQPHIDFPALTDGWIKLTSVCSCAQRKAACCTQARDGRRERERERGREYGGRAMRRSNEEGYSENIHSSVREQGIEICCVYSSSLKKKGSAFFCALLCPSVALQCGLI